MQESYTPNIGFLYCESAQWKWADDRQHPGRAALQRRL